MRRMSTWISSSRLHRRPGLIDPGIRRSRLALRPSRGRGDVPDGDGDDPRRIEDGERNLRHLLAEAGDRVLVLLVVVRPHVHVSSRFGAHHATELAEGWVV